jgi:hypothetical protein
MASRPSRARPTLGFRVGFIGHRDLTGVETELLQRQIRTVLSDIKRGLGKNDDSWGYSEAPAQLYLVNSLAEGADQLAAACATEPDLGFQLRCPVPFTLDSYKSHFEYQAEDARKQFDRLIDEPETCVVMMGCSDEDGKRQVGYRAAATMLLDNSDLIIAVLDADRDHREGGTADTVKRAEHARIPVIVIDPTKPQEDPELKTWEDDPSEEVTYKSLGLSIRNIVAPHRGDSDSDKSEAMASQNALSPFTVKAQQRKRRDRFLSEPLIFGGTISRFCANRLFSLYSPWWKLIEGSGNLFIKLVDRFKGAPGNGENDVAGLDPGATEEDSHLKTIGSLQEPFTNELNMMDRLSIFYMRLYRGSFVLNYLLGGVAVLFALFSYFNPRHEVLWLVAELVVLAIIAINFLSDRIWKWNERATDYRCLAELFRQQAVLAPLIRVTPFTRMPVHHQHGDPDTTWMSWYFRAIVRSVCHMPASHNPGEDSKNILHMTTGYLQAVHNVLLNQWLWGQQQFHHKLARRFVYVNRVFHGLAIVLFVGTVGVCILHLQHPSSYDQVSEVANSLWREGALMAILPAVLPAFLAALHGLSMQAEFERLAERSESMARHLEKVGERFTEVTPSSVDNFGLEIGRRASEIALTMLEEVLDWRVIYLGHSTELT